VRIKPANLAVGQKVWYYYPRRRQGLSPKFQLLYTGPFEVVRVIDPSTVVIRRSARHKPFVTHRDKLKPVYEYSDPVADIEPDSRLRVRAPNRDYGVENSDGGREGAVDDLAAGRADSSPAAAESRPD
jgi:hypothetical protein